MGINTATSLQIVQASGSGDLIDGKNMTRAGIVMRRPIRQFSTTSDIPSRGSVCFFGCSLLPIPKYGKDESKVPGSQNATR